MSQMNGDGTVYARGLRKSFGDRVVLDSIDLDVDCGEIVCIIGPSGSGKSTLPRCVDGLEEIDRGVLRVNGEELRPEERLLQDGAVHPHVLRLGPDDLHAVLRS